MRGFQPTYLYIKQHKITKKLYFGKTCKEDPISYSGSGKHWKRHLKKHGKEHIDTIWYCLFYDKEEIKEFALMCSEQWNIVKSKDWANFKPENGLDGGNPKGQNKGIKRGPWSEERKSKKSKEMKGKNSGPQSPETILKKSKKRIKRWTLESRIKKSNLMKGKPWTAARREAQLKRKIKNEVDS